ncbi:MAG: HAD-IA family hydrolase [Candidatus Yanofskybacteria bacterium]|nr:HAD-IA family hydrolase [Candidatus Yanofskybacteria bacterium]
MIKALIFDVGGVLFLAKSRKEKNLLSSFNEACLLLENFGIDVTSSKEKLTGIYKKSSGGDITREETLALMSTELGVTQTQLEEYFRRVYSDNSIENKELYGHILKFKKDGLKIGILSTQFHLSKDVLVPAKYYENFDALVISCDDKLKKPEEKSFILILRRLGVKPEETIFIDDKQENLDIAEKLGMKSVLFKNNKQFFSKLKKFDIE